MPGYLENLKVPGLFIAADQDAAFPDAVRVLRCTVVYCSVLSCTVMYCGVLWCSVGCVVGLVIGAMTPHSNMCMTHDPDKPSLCTLRCMQDIARARTLLDGLHRQQGVGPFSIVHYPGTFHGFATRWV